VFTPPQSTKHLNFAPTAAQSASTWQRLVQAWAIELHPASEICPMPRQKSPAAQSPSDEQLTPEPRNESLQPTPHNIAHPTAVANIPNRRTILMVPSFLLPFVVTPSSSKSGITRHRYAFSSRSMMRKRRCRMARTFDGNAQIIGYAKIAIAA